MSDTVPSSPAPQFTLAIRGYDRLQVDTYVQHLREQLEECATRLHRTEERAVATARARTERIAELEQRLTALEQGHLGVTGPTAAAVGGRIAQMLDLAVAEAAEVKERAGREAEQLLEKARREAHELRQDQAGAYEQLQRQLLQLRASVLAVLDGSASFGTTGHAEDVRTGDERSRPLLDQVTQVLDAAAVATTAPQRRPVR